MMGSCSVRGHTARCASPGSHRVPPPCADPPTAHPAVGSTRTTACAPQNLHRLRTPRFCLHMSVLVGSRAALIAPATGRSWNRQACTDSALSQSPQCHATAQSAWAACLGTHSAASVPSTSPQVETRGAQRQAPHLPPLLAPDQAGGSCRLPHALILDCGHKLPFVASLETARWNPEQQHLPQPEDPIAQHTAWVVPGQEGLLPQKASELQLVPAMRLVAPESAMSSAVLVVRRKLRPRTFRLLWA
mmetsp:Transcript_83427/g.244601  ORF Transcript_83427/g.244601 Transcript_83427/m.244601 type:complete len:246 (-) Transcript_83427:15-752(-)